MKIIASLLTVLSLTASAATADNPFETPDHTRNAFGIPFSNLDSDQRREFSFGNSFFTLNWEPPGHGIDARDGLGPTFNAVSCADCHSLNGRGPGLSPEGGAFVSLLFRLEGAEAQYGGQLNPFAVEGVKGEGQPYIRFEMSHAVLSGGERYELRKPVISLINWMFGEPPKHTRVSARVANQLIGLGLLQEIPASEIEALADPEDKNRDGISGRANYALNLRTGEMVLGRFGWKAEQPTVEQQSAAAFNGDMGLTTTLFPAQNCPAPQIACQGAPTSHATPEVDDQTLSRVSHYMRSVAVPTRRPLPSDEGEKTFTRIGCASCHSPRFEVNGVAIFPYTDLLLHDMGADLNDFSMGGDLMPTEWRTPPLWGIGLIETVNGHQNLLHDGRARGVQEAILWHGGEAAAARKAYAELSKPQRRAVIDFVNSL